MARPTLIIGIFLFISCSSDGFLFRRNSPVLKPPTQIHNKKKLPSSSLLLSSTTTSSSSSPIIHNDNHNNQTSTVHDGSSSLKPPPTNHPSFSHNNTIEELQNTFDITTLASTTSSSLQQLEEEADTRQSDNDETTTSSSSSPPNRKIDLRMRKLIDRSGGSEQQPNNIDDVRRARSLARRDRMARWRAGAAQIEENYRVNQDNYFLLAAFLPAVLAFVLWGNISIMISNFLNIVGVVNSAQGEAFANNLLRPTIIGVVVPVISIALATLVSTTVNVLRQRQVDLRAFINQEAGELRFLRRAVFGLYGTRQHAGRRARALALLNGYTEQLMKECSAGAVEELEEMQLTGGIASNELDRLSAMLHGVDGAAASRQGSIANADDLILSLNGHRSKRVALLLTDFPAIHWDILAGLNVSIIISFLLASNQPVLQYLDSVQLRFLFAVVVGVASGTAILCWDLDNPFSGTFSIAGASSQLADLRVCLREDVREAVEESEEISTRTREFFRTKFSGPTIDFPSSNESRDENSSRYGLLSTIYFHLLTGPFGAYLRLCGDFGAYLATFLGRKLRALVYWKRWRWLRRLRIAPFSRNIELTTTYNTTRKKS